MYNKEVAETMMWPSELQNYIRARFVVIYKSPLPRIQVPGTSEVRESSKLEELLLQLVPRESATSNRVGSYRGVFARPLTEQAFEKHVKGLEFY